MNPCFTFNKIRRVIIVFPISAFFNYVFVALSFNTVSLIPIEVQNSAKFLLIDGHSYSVIHKMYPNVGLSTLSRYKRKFLGNSISPTKGGKQNKISIQTRNYIAKNLQKSSFNSPKDVQSYLLTLGVEMSLRGIIYLHTYLGQKALKDVV